MKFFFLILFFITTLSHSQNINIGIQDSIYSETMKDIRPFSVYFPPSYYAHSNQKYPVLYILDGDYNFQYVAGLIELQSSISENIPEMILIGISGKDSKTYKKNCIPEESDSKLQGNANKVFKFINTELVPFIEQKYKANEYKILSGHSKGGLFTINSALHEPRAFNHYIAISPALWYENNSINTIAKDILKKNKDFKTNVYISLANEKGMGVSSFLKVATTSIFVNPIVIYGLAILGFILSMLLYKKLNDNSKLKRFILPILTFTSTLLFCT
jgi:predicted alpha/beta superfamily hydrolase